MLGIAKYTDSFAGLKRRLAISVFLLNLLVFSIAGLSLFHSRNDYEKMTAVSTQNIASIIDHHIKGEINSIDIALIAVKYEAEGQIVQGGIDKEALSRYMTRQRSFLPALQGLWMTDSKGDIIYGAGPVMPRVVVNIVDRDYFIFERDNPKGDLFIAKPVLGRLSKKWVLNIARRVNNPDGSFAGTVFGNLSLSHFINIFGCSLFYVGKPKLSFPPIR